MSKMPDLIGMELEKGLGILSNNDLSYRLKEYNAPRKSYPDNLLKRIVRQRKLDSGEIEIVFCVDTYQLGEDIECE